MPYELAYLSLPRRCVPAISQTPWRSGNASDLYFMNGIPDFLQLVMYFSPMGDKIDASPSEQCDQKFGK